MLFRPGIGVGSPVKCAEPKLAVGHQWGYAEMLRQSPGLAVTPLGLLHGGCGTVAGDLAQQVEGVGLMAPGLVRERKVARLLGDGLGALSPPAHQKPVPEMRG